MNLTGITYTSVAQGDIAALRSHHLRGLRFGQDALVEAFAQSSQAIALDWKKQRVGYSLMRQDKLCVEFWVQPDFVPYAHLAYRRWVQQNEIRGALVQSFDDLHLSCALDINQQVEVMGDLTRGYIPRPLPQIERIRYYMRRAQPHDLSRLLLIDQQVFTHPGRLSAAIAAGQLQLFERPPQQPGEDAQLLGFGLIRQVVPERREAEIGLAVDVPFRNKGYAIYFLRELAEEALRQDFQPISGCAADNEASVRMGLRIGLHAHHRLLRIGF